MITARVPRRLAPALGAALVLGGALALGAPPSGKSSVITGPAVDAKALPRIPPVEAARALATFQIRKGFRIEMVASEPLVVDPVALAFDDDGRLFVAEMPDYPERGKERLGRIRRLEDVDGDGRFDKATVFAKDLSWPTSVFWYGGGVFVAAAPDILFFRDTNGDGVADERQVVFTGFGNRASSELDPGGNLNSFQWGLDNRIHGATSGNRGAISKPGDPAAKAVDLGGDDFSFDPRTRTLFKESGGGQHGLSFDDVGRKYVCNNAHHIMSLLYERRYADRNPYFSMPGARVDIPVDGGAAPVFRISPEEPWRVMRTKWRTTGVVEGMIEGGGRSAGYFTAATGVTIYRGNAWPREFAGDAFVGDVAGNLVHRKKVVHLGPSASARRPDDEKTVEFLASRDSWFRPVSLANAPDGTLYVADMYRETIETPTAIPESIKAHLDLYSGNDRGRIYRIVPDGFKQPPGPRLSRATTSELVALLEHPNGWHRDAAARLLFEKNDRGAIPALSELVTRAKSPVGRLNALYALAGLGALDERLIVRALGDGDAAVREHAVRLSEGIMKAGVPSRALWSPLSARASDASVGVRYQLAFTLGQVRHPERMRVMARIARSLGGDASDGMMRAAILSSAAEGAGELFGLVASGPGPSSRALLRELAGVVGASRRAPDLDRVKRVLNGGRDPSLAFSVARGLGEGLRRGGSSFEAAGVDLAPLLARARTLVGDRSAAESARIEAIALLAFASGAETRDTLLHLLDPREPQSVQMAAVAALDRLSPPGLAADVLRPWGSYGPGLRAEILGILLKRPNRIEGLLAALEAGTVARRDLSLMQVLSLRQQSDPALRARAVRVVGVATDEKRQEVVKRFLPAIEMRGNSARGKIIFEQRCRSCHRFANDGFAVGPDLITARNAGREKLLVNFLDPNREVQASYFAYVVETKDHESATGIVVNESANSVTLRQAFGNDAVIPRTNIVKLQAQSVSLMPEGLEEGLTAQDVADLLEFISST